MRLGLRQSSGVVFGTFDVRYDMSEFERENESGLMAIGLNPDCRVFVFGTEITKDVTGVSIDAKLDGSSCNITLANPNGKYTITKTDLMKKWREDKDILAAYVAPEYQRVDRSTINQISDALLGTRGSEKVKSAVGMLQGLRNAIPGKIPNVQTSTRMIFETKHFSGYTKRSGDIVFDYRDPVYVFFKGRFSPYWYFGFSGCITGFDERFVYGSDTTITLQCEDVTTLWKKAKLTTRGAFFNMARLESRYRNNQQSAAMRFLRPEDQYNLRDFIKVITTTFDYGLHTKNCHISTEYGDLTSLDNYQQALEVMHSDAKIDDYFMLTSSRNMVDIYGNRYKIPISDIKYGGMEGKLNDLRFSPSTSIYIQYNECVFEKYDSKYFNNYLNTSVRYWECDHRIKKNLPDTYVGSGWEDNHAFGICGIHPALPYEFVNNFNILYDIWEQCYIHTSENLDKLNITPRDKILESYVGNPGEVAGNYTRGNSSPNSSYGTSANLFRPRVFLYIPQRYSSLITAAGASGAFQRIGTLFNEENTTILTYLRERLKIVEYVCYASPAGDIFITPENYDFHPLDHCSINDSRNIVIKSDDVKYRIEKYSDPNAVYQRDDKAYMFNPKANHPFFIMNKDLTNVTQTFKHDMIYTSLKVQGGQNERAGILQILRPQTTDMFAYLGAANPTTSYTGLESGMYVADGFRRNLGDRVSDVIKQSLDQEIERAGNELYANVLYQLYKNDLNSTLSSLLTRFYDQLAKWSYPLPEGSEIETIVLKYLDYENAADAIELQALRDSFYYGLLGISQLELSGTVTAFLNAHGVPTLDTQSATSFLDSYRSQNLSMQVASALDSLFYLYLPIAIEDASVATTYMKFTEIWEQKSVNALCVTNALLKKFEREGLYNPTLDYERWYGYNKGPDITNHYIRNGAEADDYAKIALMRVASKAYSYQFGMIGRPEILLNYTYFLEWKDSIGLLTHYNISYNFGSEFTLTGALDYIRKNTITYAYSNGEFDALKGRHNNKYFKKEADNYYRWNKLLKAAGDKLEQVVTKKMNKKLYGKEKYTGEGSNVTSTTGNIAGKIAGKLVKGLVPLGGIFVSHDWIGHMEYDKRGFDAILERQGLSVPSELEENTALYIIAVDINNTLRELENMQREKTELETEKTHLLSTMNSLSDQIRALRDQQSTAGDVLQLQSLEAQYTDIYTQLAQIQSLLASYEDMRRQYYRALYGDPFGREDYMDKPADVTEWVRALYRTSMDIDKEPTGPYADEINYLLRSGQGHDGLYYQLFVAHILSFGGSDSEWVVDESGTMSINVRGRSPIPYYIKPV